MNLLFSLKGDKTSATPMPTIPSTKGPSATMEILARAVSTEAPIAQGVAEFDFSRIKVAFQPKPPAYPVDAKAKRIQGTVVISITIDEQGMPQSVEALRARRNSSFHCNRLRQGLALRACPAERQAHQGLIQAFHDALQNCG
ncbi:MAG: TonB family protein [Holophaga sp.]|nr:TonB family protein [Holophaga sp.]